MKKFIGGMVKDPERVDQPESTYRDALNANLYYIKGAVVNEQGTTPITNVGFNFADNIIGQCALKDGRIVVFFNYTLQNNTTSAISIVDPSEGTNTLIYRNAELNFQPSNTIEATFKENANGNVLVYFTDNYIQKQTEPVTGIEYILDYNPPRVINITRQIAEGNANRLYDNADYTVQKLDLFLNSGLIPEFRNIQIEEGGGVVSGTYHLALAYVDEDINRTNYLTTSNPVHVVTEHEDRIPTEAITGDPQGSQSNKTIIWNIDIPIPSNYTHVRPVIIQRLGGGINQEQSEFAYELEIVRIPDAAPGSEYVQMDIAYTGLEQVVAATITEVVVDSVRYETAKTFVQLDNRLYMSNLRARGDIGYQRFANNIEVAPRATTVPRFDNLLVRADILNYGLDNVKTTSGALEQLKTLQTDNLQDGFFASNVRKGYKDVRMSYMYRGYRRSETYAFYISFVLKDGTESYAYHIPGRQAEILSDIGPNFYENSPVVPNQAAIESYGTDLTEFADLFPDSKFHELVDTQYVQSETSNAMSYWENADERYPDTDDFRITSINTNDGSLFNSGDLRNQNVRHHKMPPNKNLIYSFIDELDPQGVGAPPGQTGTTQMFPHLYNESTVSQGGMRDRSSIQILGVQFSNIQVPQFIRDQVQGYKIYYAKRTQENKSVIGQSVLVPAWYEEAAIVAIRAETAYSIPAGDAYRLAGQPVGLRRSIPFHEIITADNSIRQSLGVFTFHDFNLLKNKHTLSGASHIDVQKILTMRMWAGGNDSFSKDDAFLYNLDWINSTIGNETWYEWVEFEGNEGDTELAPVALTNTTEFPGVKNYWTSVLVAQRYDNPDIVQRTTGTDIWWNQVASAGNWIGKKNTIFTLAPNSITYITGSTLLKNIETGSFKSVENLLHYAGESCIALGLTSALPPITERRSLDSLNFLLLSHPGMWWWDAAPWHQGGQEGESEWDHPTLEEFNFVNYALWPTLYLVNLCAYKRNMYQPFDKQRLVWTGTYVSLDIEDRTTQSFTPDGVNIYSSPIVFGGDTYVGRYSMRTTSQDYGALYSNKDLNELKDPEQGNEAKAWASNPFENNSFGVGSSSKVKYRPIDPYSCVYSFFCESDDLLGFRHQGDNAEGVTVPESLFFPASTGSDVLFGGPNNDYTKSEHLLYMNNYSAVQDIKTTVPLPKKLFSPTFYGTRTIRSNVDDASIQDKYRFFLSLDYKDLPRNRGEITKLFTLSSILYLHTERSLFVTRGRQQLGLGDSTQAFVGSGDIFEQNPDEMVPTTEGYGGTDTQFASLTTRFGQFYVNRKDRKVYMMGQNIEELSGLGMEKWFLDNIPYAIEQYFDLETENQDLISFDAPTEFFGFTAAYDPKYKRIILSKKERVPTAGFLALISQGISNVQAIDGGVSFYSEREGEVVNILFGDDTYFQDNGWTVSYYPELKVWGSRHSYIPTIFSNNQQQYYGLVNGAGGNVWEHSNLNNPGNYYNQQYNFEFEYIDNSEAGASKIFSSIRYWTEVVRNNNIAPGIVDKYTSPAFTSFYTYNSNQISGERQIYYLTNARLVDRFWYINDFRDLSDYELNQTAVVANNQLNVQDIFNTGSTTNPVDTPMFTEEGVINNNYINPQKFWYNQKKFVDNFLGVRLISNNAENNLIYLYAAGTKFRQSFR